MRSKKNSKSFSTDYDVFKEIINFYNKNLALPKFLVHLRPTCPLRKDDTIRKAINYFKKIQSSYSSLKSVTLNSHNSLKDYFIKNSRLFSINKKNGNDIDKVNIPQQNLEKTYIGNNIIDIYKTKNILKGELLGKKVYPFITEDIFCDIDNKKDFNFAKHLSKIF